MVGGYVLLARKPLVPGDNNIAAMYGTLDDANSRVESLTLIQKPVLVEYNLTVQGVTVKASSFFEFQGKTNSVITLKSAVGTIAYNRTTGVAVLTFRND